MATQEPRSASVIGNVMAILRCFTIDEPQQSVTGIAAQVGLHKSSVSRILAALQAEHVVEQDPESRKYHLGLGLITVAGPLLANLDVRSLALDAMREVAEQTRETVALSVWDHGAAITVEQVPSTLPVKHTSVLGSRYRTYSSATVQVFLAFGEEDLGSSEADGSIGLEDREGEDAYRQRLAAVRDRGYAVNDRETSEDAVGIAAPVRDHRGEVVAALLVAAPSYRTGPEDIERYAQICRQAAHRIERRLGYLRPL